MAGMSDLSLQIFVPGLMYLHVRCNAIVELDIGGFVDGWVGVRVFLPDFLAGFSRNYATKSVGI